MSTSRRLHLISDQGHRDWLDGAVRIAFASSNMRSVNQHFGTARAFAIYAIDHQHAQLIEANHFDAEAMDGNEDKLRIKLEALQGCIAIYSQAVGASAIRQLKAHHIEPQKVPADTPISLIVTDLQRALQMESNHWLTRAIYRQQQDDPHRFDAMVAEGWQE